MLISPAFFFGEINIPNSSATDISTSISNAIAFHEPEIMQRLLGYDLYTQFNAHTTDQRFQDLLNGKEYTSSGYSTKWRGLIYTSGGKQFSLLAFYIYFFIMKDTAIWNSGLGTSLPDGKEAKRVSPAMKMINAYNIFVRQSRELADFMNSSLDVYPEYTNYNCFMKPINDFDI